MNSDAHIHPPTKSGQSEADAHWALVRAGLAPPPETHTFSNDVGSQIEHHRYQAKIYAAARDMHNEAVTELREVAS